MTMDACTENMSWATCQTCYQGRYDVRLQDAMDESKPWIGMYIAAASAFCVIAMAFDVFNGFKTKKLWFPCKYFSLNATSLTLAMKLSMDLTRNKDIGNPTFAGYSSTVLMSSAMGNFMTSLASMNDNDAMLNLIALGILVITVVVNQWIFTIQSHKVYGDRFIYVLSFDDYVSVFLLLLLILLCTSAVVVPITKRYVETKFWEMHKIVLNERVQGAKFTARELTVLLKKYWVMAGTGNPQFVMARSVICVIPSMVCLSMTITLLVLIGIYINEHVDHLFYSDSVYKWSIDWILFIQTMGAVIATIAPTSRLIVAARFRSSRAGLKGFKEELTTETCWTQRLIDWRESPMPVRIRHVRSKKILHISKKVLLNICIILQIVIILSSKLILIILSWFINGVFEFVHLFKFTTDRGGHEPIAAGTNELDFTPYIMLLESELGLPNWIIANISNEADKLIQVGKMQKPKHIIELLQKSENFNGVSNFDRKSIASLHAQEPRNCWSISLATLTSIAISLPNISSKIVSKLFSTVSEGLQFVKFIEKKFDTSGELVRIRKTADIIWERLELDQKWQDKYVVQGNNRSDQTYNAKLIELSTKAKKTVMDFKTSTTNSVMDNPLNWPLEIIAANSMYRVCESLLLIEIDDIGDKLDQIFFERLSIIISEILATCLTNLAHVIFRECYINSMEKRHESTRRALILLGESEEIIQCLEHREWPNLDPDKAGYIEEWRAILELNNENPAYSVSTTYDMSIPQSLSGKLVVKVEG